MTWPNGETTRKNTIICRFVAWKMNCFVLSVCSNCNKFHIWFLGMTSKLVGSTNNMLQMFGISSGSWKSLFFNSKRTTPRTSSLLFFFPILRSVSSWNRLRESESAIDTLDCSGKKGFSLERAQLADVIHVSTKINKNYDNFHACLVQLTDVYTSLPIRHLTTHPERIWHFINRSQRFPFFYQFEFCLQFEISSSGNKCRIFP